MVPAFALMVAAACSGDSFTDVQGDLDRLQADPSQVFLEVGESRQVTIEGVDAGGNPITATYEVTDQGSNFDIRRDSTFLPVYVDDSTLQVPPAAERFRFVVTGTAYGASSFTVSAGGKDITIPVQVVPQNTIEAGLSNLTPALGETVTITAPAGTHFTPASVVRLPDTTAFAQPFTVSVAADGSTLDVILPPNLIESRLNITNVQTDGASTVTFSPTTAIGVTTPAVPSFNGTTSNLTPAVNEPVTVTLQAGQTFSPEATVIAGAVAPVVTNLTPTTVTFIPSPGTTALPLINGVVLPEVPNIPVSLSAPLTDTMVVSPDIPTVPGTEGPGSAPSLIDPAEGFSSVLYDKPAYDNAGRIDAYYKLVVTQEGLYTITLDWTLGTDIDLFFCPENDLFGETCATSFADHPEAVEVELTPGTYFLISEDFGQFIPPSTVIPDAAGTTLTITVDHAPPEVPEAVKAAKVKTPVALYKQLRRH